jgi:1-acyl-sn-glycerol-3-phosphate acyltransferase
MENIVIDKPYSFVPPVRSRFWPAIFRPLLRPYLSKTYGVTSVEITGIDTLRDAVAQRASIVLMPNHCRPSDPTVVTVLGAAAGTPVFTMASWHLFMGNRLQAWVLRRLGGFSVYREGLDRAAIKCAIELLVDPQRPLVIFPEGIITRANDRLGAFMDGPAFIARSAAKQRAKSQPGARTLLVPVALRYHFLGRLEESVAPVLDRIETRLTWTPRPELPLIDRLQRTGSAILGLKELELVGEVRSGGISERLARLVDEILVPFEEEWKIKKRESDVPARVRGLRAAILPDMVEGGITDAERERRWGQLARLYLVQQLALFPAGYLAGNPTKERVLETVERLEEDLTDVATVHRPITVAVRVGEPIEVTPDAAPAALTKEARVRIATLLGVLSENEVRTDNPPARARTEQEER